MYGISQKLIHSLCQILFYMTNKPAAAFFNDLGHRTKIISNDWGLSHEGLKDRKGKHLEAYRWDNDSHCLSIENLPLSFG